MTKCVSVTATAVPGGVDLRASVWDFQTSPYPRQLAYRRVGASQSWRGDGDKLRALAAALLDLAEQLYPEQAVGREVPPIDGLHDSRSD